MKVRMFWFFWWWFLTILSNKVFCTWSGSSIHCRKKLRRNWGLLEHRGRREVGPGYIAPFPKVMAVGQIIRIHSVHRTGRMT